MITEHSPYRREMKTDRMKVPVVFHVQEALMPNEATLAQLESVASNDACFHHIAAMADVHSKPGRKNATGTTICSEHSILPQVNDSDPACGMRLVRTNLNESNFSPEDIDRLFTALVRQVPTKAPVSYTHLDVYKRQNIYYVTTPLKFTVHPYSDGTAITLHPTIPRTGPRLSMSMRTMIRVIRKRPWWDQTSHPS